MANVITLLFVDLAAMLDQAAVATQAAQLKWDDYAPAGNKPQLKWHRDAIGVGQIFLASALKHKKKEYWVDSNRDAAHALATRVGTLAAQYAKTANSNATIIGKADLEKALQTIFGGGAGRDEPCPF